MSDIDTLFGALSLAAGWTRAGLFCSLPEVPVQGLTGLGLALTLTLTLLASRRGTRAHIG